MYQPPEDEDSIYKDEYDEGYEAALANKKESGNPYKPSRHERDTTTSDDRHYFWYCGFNDFFERN